MEKQEQGLAINEKSFLTLDKGRIVDIAQSVVDRYTDGFNSPTEGLLLAKKLMDLGEAIKTNIADNAANELKLAPSEKRVVLGATLTEQMVGVRYDFTACQSKKWNELKKQIEEEEKFLKGITNPIEMVDTDTGETYTVYPPVKSGKLSLIIKY